MNLFKCAIAFLTIILMASCSEQKQADNANQPAELLTSKEKKTSISGSYQKPGAAVRFSHNYDGISESGENENVTLSFNHGYNAGTISILLEPQDGLELANNLSPYAFALGDEQAIAIETSLSAAADGKYYLNIFATVDDLSGNPISRVFALALNVGESGKNAKSTMEPVHMSLEEGSSGKNIILMPAEETISQ